MDNTRTSCENMNMEEVINQIPDVISSRVVCKEGQIAEIHVLASNQRGPKQLSRDIQSALTAKYGIDVDYRTISIAQIDSEQSMSREFRLKFDSVQYSSAGNMAQVSVFLVHEDDRVEGTASGLGSKNNIYRLLARATLACIHQALGTQDILIVEDVEVITLAKQQVAVVAISYMSNEAENMLTGSAIVRKGEYETIVKATLDAVNRRISKFKF